MFSSVHSGFLESFRNFHSLLSNFSFCKTSQDCKLTSFFTTQKSKGTFDITWSQKTKRHARGQTSEETFIYSNASNVCIELDHKWVWFVVFFNWPLKLFMQVYWRTNIFVFKMHVKSCDGSFPWLFPKKEEFFEYFSLGILRMCPTGMILTLSID